MRKGEGRELRRGRDKGEWEREGERKILGLEKKKN